MKYLRFLGFSFILLFILMPKISFGEQAQTCNMQVAGQNEVCEIATGATSCKVPSGETCYLKLSNPIKAASLLEFVKAIFDIVWKIGIPVIALFIIYAGFRFVQARGNSTELEKAKKMLVGVLIGAAIVLGAWVLASAIGQTIQRLQSAVYEVNIKLALE